jgi:membrane protease YdiL (CAAX protease family)
MPDVSAWTKLAAYVICIGLALEFAHQTYWRVNRGVISMNVGAAWRSALSALSAAIPLVSVVLVTDAFCVAVDHRPFWSLGLQWNARSFGFFASAAVIACTIVSLLFVIGCRIGWFRVQRSMISKSQAPAFCGGASDFLLAAVFEEITMRGYVFLVLEQSWGVVAAIVGSAAIFSIFHLVKHPRMPLIFTLNAFFFGLVTGLARAVTGGLWAPIGLHFGWNMAMGPVFGLPCSGRNYDDGLVCCHVDGPEWVTGGLYSPDAGVLGTAALVLATAALTLILPAA